MPVQIHESLRLTNLSKLPLSLRTSAKSAADGSYSDLQAIFASFPDLPKRTRLLILPVLYLHLNLDGLPPLAQLDAICSDPNREEELHRILIAIECLNTLSVSFNQDLIPKGAYADLWPRLHPWVIFFYTYHDLIPFTTPPPAAMVIRLCGDIVVGVDKYKPMSDRVRSSSQVRAVLTAYWATLLGPDAGDSMDADSGVPGATVRDERCTNILAILSDDPYDKQNLADMMEGAGDSDTLTYLLVTQLNYFLARGFSKLTVITANTALAIVGSVSVRRVEEDAFNRGLHFHGIAKALAGTLCALDVWFHQGGGRTYFRWRVGHEAIARALDGGLLTFIVSSRTLPANAYPIIKNLLEALIPGALVYYPVVCQMRISYAEALTYTTASTFARSKIAPLWEKFTPVVKLRLGALEFFHSPQWISSKVCENMECFKLAEKVKFKTCSGCDYLYYCSPECQKADWKAGHRQWCPKLAPLVDFPGLVRPRSRAFLRAMLLYNLAQFRPQIMLHQAYWMYAAPDTPFFTSFDFQTLGTDEPFVKIEPLATYARAPEAGLRLAQLAKSRGRMQLHAVIINGNPPLLKMFCLWSTSAHMVDGMQRIVKALPPGLKYEDAYPKLIMQLRTLHMECVASQIHDVYL
ncbi:hypothetical protein C8R46DRAFT_1356365 [Mycena filopes]|nr:hypothetical protein C8R46DRAFT_1356365 [Mycena filopes]